MNIKNIPNYRNKLTSNTDHRLPHPELQITRALVVKVKELGWGWGVVQVLYLLFVDIIINEEYP